VPLALPVLKTSRFRGTGMASGTHDFIQNHFFDGLLTVIGQQCRDDESQDCQLSQWRLP
jgi:hypothetical protein